MMSELKTLDSHEHPHIVRVLDLCEDTKNIYIVSELIRHGTLEENLRRIKENHIIDAAFLILTYQSKCLNNEMAFLSLEIKYILCSPMIPALQQNCHLRTVKLWE